MDHEFPRLVYKSAASYVLVNNYEEMAGALANGWYASVPEATDKEHSEESESIASAGKVLEPEISAAVVRSNRKQKAAEQKTATEQGDPGTTAAADGSDTAKKPWEQ